MSVLIDTNILVYAWDAGDKRKQMRAIECLRRHRDYACLSVQNLSEFSSVMMKKGCDMEWLSRVVSLYSSMMSICMLRPEDVTQALHAVSQYQMSFWDAQIWAVAAANRIPVILSEDGPSGQEIEGVQFRNPFV